MYFPLKKCTHTSITDTNNERNSNTWHCKFSTLRVDETKSVSPTYMYDTPLRSLMRDTFLLYRCYTILIYIIHRREINLRRNEWWECEIIVFVCCTSKYITGVTYLYICILDTYALHYNTTFLKCEFSKRFSDTF